MNWGERFRGERGRLLLRQLTPAPPPGPRAPRGGRGGGGGGGRCTIWMQAPPLSLNLTPHGKLHHKAKAYEVTENFETFVTFQHPHLPGRATEWPPETSLQRYIAVVGTSLWSVHPLAMPNAQALAMPNAQPPPPIPRGGDHFWGTIFRNF